MMPFQCRSFYKASVLKLRANINFTLGIGLTEKTIRMKACHSLGLNFQISLSLVDVTKTLLVDRPFKVKLNLRILQRWLSNQ